MCGFAYYKLLEGAYDLDSLACNALDILRRRGPDASNYLVSPSRKDLFCHSRLTIIGDSANGAQPAVSDDDQTILLFNGEIYNYEKLSQGFHNLTENKSDTNFLMRKLCDEGETGLDQMDGMFAFLKRGFKDDTLILARDLAGQKPLYYGTIKNADTKFFCATSDLRCISIGLRSHFPLNVDPEVINHYFKFGMTPAET